MFWVTGPGVREMNTLFVPIFAVIALINFTHTQTHHKQKCFKQKHIKHTDNPVIYFFSIWGNKVKKMEDKVNAAGVTDLSEGLKDLGNERKWLVNRDSRHPSKSTSTNCLAVYQCTTEFTVFKFKLFFLIPVSWY